MLAGLLLSGLLAFSQVAPRVVTWSSNYTAAAKAHGSGLEGQKGTSALTVAAPAPPGTAWPNEPAGFTLISDYAFNDALPVGHSVPVARGWSINNESGLATRVVDSTVPLSPSFVGQWKYPKGFVDGRAPATIYHPISGRELYVGFRWKPSSPFDPNQSGVDKIAFTFSQTNLLSYIAMRGTSAPYSIAIGDAPLGNGQTLWPNVATSPVALGVWHRIEVYQKYSATATSNDGVVRWWVDGVLNGDYPTLNFAQDGGFSEFQFSPTYGGNSGATKSEDDFYWFDHVHLSRR